MIQVCDINPKFLQVALCVGPDSEYKKTFISQLSNKLAESKRDGYVDIQLITPDEKTKLFSMEQFKQLISDSAMLPIYGKFKVFVIHDADLITDQQASLLLKILEESDTTKFIFGSINKHNVLSTIASRCVEFSFSYFSDVALKEYVEKASQYSEIKMNEVVDLSQGDVSFAECLLEEKYQLLLEVAKKLVFASFQCKFSQLLEFTTAFTDIVALHSLGSNTATLFLGRIIYYYEMQLFKSQFFTDSNDTTLALNTNATHYVDVVFIEKVLRKSIVSLEVHTKLKNVVESLFFSITLERVLKKN